MNLVLGLLIVASSLLALPVAATAQTACRSTLSGTYDDVLVTGGKCTLAGAVVRGSVMVTGGKLIATNGTQINGSVMGSGAKRITLDGDTQVNGGVLADSMGHVDIQLATVLGDVSLVASGHLRVGPDADLGGVKVEGSGKLMVSGSLASIESMGSGEVTLVGATLFPGSLVVSKGLAGVEICDSTVAGELKVTETDGSVTVDGTCGMSTIEGTVSVEKGTGNVELTDAVLAAGDLIVVEQAGSVVVSGSTLSDVKVEKITGAVTLENVSTDSDTTLSGNGNVTITGSALGSDVSIEENKEVLLRGNDFSLEDVSVAKNAGPVRIVDNGNFSISILENDGVTFRRNDFTDADISKNSGGVGIKDNVGEVLKCTDNSPAPVGSGNTISELADGQCADLF